jgi:hypothetical protein
MRGDFAIAWRYQDLPNDKSWYDSAAVSIQVLMLIPPSAKGVLRLPIPPTTSTTASIRSALRMPDVNAAKAQAHMICEERRRNKLGFSYNWDYDRKKKEWFKRYSGKAIGTSCDSFLFHELINEAEWDEEKSITDNLQKRTDQHLEPGLYEVIIANWKLEKEIEGNGPHGSRLGSIPDMKKRDVGPYCADSSTAEWEIEDGTHII